MPNRPNQGKRTGEGHQRVQHPDCCGKLLVGFIRSCIRTVGAWRDSGGELVSELVMVTLMRCCVMVVPLPPMPLTHSRQAPPPLCSASLKNPPPTPRVSSKYYKALSLAGCWALVPVPPSLLAAPGNTRPLQRQRPPSLPISLSHHMTSLHCSTTERTEPMDMRCRRQCQATRARSRTIKALLLLLPLLRLANHLPTVSTR